MKEVTGDLLKLALEGKYQVIVHGCNCFCNMGKGIAKQIKATFPNAYISDQRTMSGDRTKLGKFSVGFAVSNISQTADIFVVNAYTQYYYGMNRINCDYDAIRSAFKLIKEKFSGKRIAYPKIGAGEAGGNWDIISKIIDEELEGEDHTLVIWDKQS